MSNKEQDKMRELLVLAKDQETQKMIDMMAYNWEVCASRMEQITKERQQGLFRQRLCSTAWRESEH